MFVILRTRITAATLRQTSRDELLFSLKSACRNIYSVSPNDKHSEKHNTSQQNTHPAQPTEHADRTSSYQSAFGVFKESEGDDVDVLVNNFTSPALARALRERETTLHNAARLVDTHNYKELAVLLRPFLKSSIDKRRNESYEWDITNGLTRRELILIQRQLHRMPREVFQATTRRASVVIPLCNVGGIASILFERRSATVRTHKHEVCFPGGMVEEGIDATVIQTSLREMEEELGIPAEKAEVLGVLRCNWDEVANMTGVSVTPVVGYIGELNELTLTPNADEVEQLFTVPLADLLDKSKWVLRDFSTPVFTGGPFVIWGLTAYLLDRFLKDVVNKCSGQENEFMK